MGKCSKDKRDIYYRLAKEQGYRARSAFKLLQLDDTFQFLQHASRVVDLCAAPGGWSQVIAERLTPLAEDAAAPAESAANRIVAVDLMEMAPLDGVVQLKGDITSQRTVDEIISLFDGHKAQVVVSDGAPDVLGLHDLDEYLQAQLVLAALNISLLLLEESPSSIFIAKIFRGKEISLLFAQLKRFFGHVTCAKPKASRNSSFESFVVCRDFRLPPGFTPSMDRDLLDLQYQDLTMIDQQEIVSHVNECPGICDQVNFVGCGDAFGFDADQSYPLGSAAGTGADQYVHQEPLQKPINPPYADALQKKKTRIR